MFVRDMDLRRSRAAGLLMGSQFSDWIDSSTSGFGRVLLGIATGGLTEMVNEKSKGGAVAAGILSGGLSTNVGRAIYTGGISAIKDPGKLGEVSRLLMSAGTYAPVERAHEQAKYALEAMDALEREKTFVYPATGEEIPYDETDMRTVLRQRLGI